VCCVATTLVAAALSAPVLSSPAAAAVSPDVRYSDRNVVAGDTVRAVVARSSRPAGAALVLERKYLDRWRTADRTATDGKHGYVLHVPTDQYGTFAYRVVAKRNGEVVSRSDRSTVTVRPPYDPAGRGRQHTFGAKPRVRWDSCRRITWTFNPRHSPKRGLRQVRLGIRRIHLATGLDFVYAGKTDQKPNPYGNDVDNAAVIIGWRTAKDYRMFRQHPGTVGIGGNMYFSGFREADGTAVSKAVQGGVVLNASMRDKLSNGYGRGTTWGEVIIHELGHVVGLSHVDASSQIMYYSVTRRDADWGAGDLAGFRRLGDGRGCLERTPKRETHAHERFAMH
jgi:hypothetical protein